MIARLLKSFGLDKAGATAVEYGLLAALISVGMLAALTGFSDTLNNTFVKLSNSMEQAK